MCDISPDFEKSRILHIFAHCIIKFTDLPICYQLKVTGSAFHMNEKYCLESLSILTLILHFLERSGKCHPKKLCSSTDPCDQDKIVNHSFSGVGKNEMCSPSGYK